MKILVGLSNPHIVGGMEAYVHQILRFWHASDFELFVVTDEAFTNENRRLIPEGCKHMDLQSHRVDDVKAAIEAFAPEVFYCHKGLVDMAFERWLVGRYRSYLFVHDYTGLCISGNKSFKRPKRKTCHYEFSKKCLLRYLPKGCGPGQPLSITKLYLEQRQRLQTIKQYQNLICASRYVFDVINQNTNSQNVAVVPYPTTNDSFEASIAEYSAGKVLFSGRVVEAKGLNVLIKAMELVHKKSSLDVSLHVLGDGPFLADCKREAHRSQCPTVFHGWVSGEEKLGLIRDAHVNVVPSVWPEPFGLTGLEAGMYGIPSVAFNVGGIPEWLAGRGIGEVAEFSHPLHESLARAILKLLDHPNPHQLRLSAQKTARSFTLEGHHHKLMEVFHGQ